MSQWGLPGNRGGLSSYCHSTVLPEGRRPRANVLQGAVRNNPPQGSHIRPRPDARGVAALRRIPGHPRRSRRRIPDGGRPTAKGASEARAGQPRLLRGERIHGGWQRRTWGPQRVAGPAPQRASGRAERGCAEGAGPARAGTWGRGGNARSGGVSVSRAERCTELQRIQSDLGAARRRLRDTTPPGPKVSQCCGGSVVATATLTDVPGAGSRSSKGRARLL